MAKSGFNISGDSSLIAAAGQYATAQTPASMANAATSIVKGAEAFNKSIASAYSDVMAAAKESKKKEEEEKKEAYKSLKSTWDNTIQNVVEGTVDNKAQREKLLDEAEKLRIEMDNLMQMDEPDQKLIYDLQGRMNTFKRNVKRDSEDIVALATAIDNADNTLDFNVGNKYDYALAEEIAKLANAGGEEDEKSKYVETKRGPNGNTLYRFTRQGNIKYNIPASYFEGTEYKSVDDIIDNFQLDGTSVRDRLDVILDNSRKTGAQSGNTDLTFEDLMTSTERNIKEVLSENPRAFRSAIRKRTFTQDASYYDALYTEGSDESKFIFDALTQLSESDQKKFDVNNDGNFDQEDMATGDNYNKLVDRLTNPTEDTMDVAVDLAAKFYIDIESKKAYDLGVKSRQKPQQTTTSSPPGETSNRVFIDNQYVPVQNIKLDVARLNSNEDLDGVTAWNGTQWKRKNGQYFQYNKKAGEYQPSNRNSIRMNLGLGTEHGFQPREGDNVMASGGSTNADQSSFKLPVAKVAQISNIFSGKYKESAAQAAISKVLGEYFPTIGEDMEDANWLNAYEFTWKGTRYNVTKQDDAIKFINNVEQEARMFGLAENNDFSR